jgi:hypothetical protein
LAGVLFAGFAASFLTSALAGAGALAAGAGVTALTSAFAGSAAKEVAAANANRVAIIAFILSYLYVRQKLCCHIYNALSLHCVDIT